MATLIAYADGNLTGATTFKGAETGTNALAMIRNNITTIGQNGTITTPTFTVTNGKVIEGVLLFITSNNVSPAGTLLVELQKYVTSPDQAVTQASVTVNTTDLPHNATGTNDVSQGTVPVFFKFTGTATGDGTANWTLKLTTSNTLGNGFTYGRNSGTLGDLTRAFRTSTTATPAAADDLYIVGELTGAGTHNSRTVTMDSTATTAYGNGTVNDTTHNGGGVRISNYATLTYGTSASTNYYLKVNGDLEVFWNGTLTIGASGAEIPRTSTAVLEFQMASASGDFGLQIHNLATFNASGLSRTSGKNVVKTKLTSDLVGSGGLVNGASNTNSTITGTGPDAGPTLTAVTFVDNGTNGNHYVVGTGGNTTPANTTVVMTAFLARGTGTNNRFVRAEVGNSTTLGSVTNGFFADIDLQAGTIGTCTAIGSGSATSATITACGTGYVIRITGKVNTGSTSVTSPYLISASPVTSPDAGNISYAGDSTNCFNYSHWQLVQVASISDTTLNVVDDTGWLSGDYIVVASTSRTAGECEGFALNAGAGASSMVTPAYPFGIGSGSATGGTHSGTSPTQGEIGLLTRNVKIRSASTSLWGYVYFEALATVTVLWAEFYYIGITGVTNKRGIEVQTSAVAASAKSITFCSVHDCWQALLLNGGNLSLNVTFSNNIVWNTSAQAIQINGTLTNTDWTISSNLVMKVASIGVSLSDVGGTLSSNTVVGTTNVGISLNESAPLGTFDSNTVHSTSLQGLSVSVANLQGTISNFTSWRNTSTGVAFPSGGNYANLFWTNLTLFGNTTINMNLSLGCGILNIAGGTMAGDASFSTARGIDFGSSPNQLNISGVDFSGTGTGLAAHTTADIYWSSAGGWYDHSGVVNNCKFGSTPVGYASTKAGEWYPTSYIGFEKYNQAAGDHRTEMTYGQLKTDSAIYNTSTPSMRMTPSSASSKLESAPKGKGILKKATNGSTTSITVYVRTSVVGDGTAYNGNLPRLIQRASPALGQTADVVLATLSASPDLNGTWVQLSGTSSSATDDGAWEFIVDCDGTTGWVNIDDWA